MIFGENHVSKMSASEKKRANSSQCDVHGTIDVRASEHVNHMISREAWEILLCPTRSG